MKTDRLIVTGIGLALAGVVWWEREAMFEAQALEVQAQARAVRIEHQLHVNLRQAWLRAEQPKGALPDDPANSQTAADLPQGARAGFRAQPEWWRERVNQSLGSEKVLLLTSEGTVGRR